MTSILTEHANNNSLKYISLVILTLQNAVLALSMRYARTRSGDMFLSSTGKTNKYNLKKNFILFFKYFPAVVSSEVVKLLTCLVLVYIEEGKSISRFKNSINNTIIRQPLDTLKVCVPSFVYLVQNNLLYVSASHLDAATNQVTYQLKILTTAVFAVFILRRKLFVSQWGALVMLVVGVACVQLAQTDGESGAAATKQQNIPGAPEQNRLLGFCAALGACFLSGFAGIYFEKILKGSDVSVWMRNVQLSFLSLPFGILVCFVNDGKKLTENGFFFGYDLFIWYLVILQACGGLLVAVVVKYADNILKGFATSLAIIISSIASIYLFNFNLTFQFTFGAFLVILSIFLYGYDPNAGTKNVKPVKAGSDDEKLLISDKV